MERRTPWVEEIMVLLAEVPQKSRVIEGK